MGVVGSYLAGLFGVEGSIGYITILAAVTVGYMVTTRVIFPDKNATTTKNKEDATTTVNDDVTEDSPPEPQRNFTMAQLRHFDGKKIESKFAKEDEMKPVYLSIKSIVFDVSKGRDYYGPGGPYEMFAGRECGAALAKMSFEEHFLDNPQLCDTLNFGEKTELDGWLQKFEHYRNYPILGRLVVDMPDPERIISVEELTANNGYGNIPNGYATAPIYVAVDGLVFDMSFGGVSFYGKGGPYQTFAGHDVTRALAVMKIDEAGSGNNDLSDLTEQQIKTMKDWVKTFRERKQYPIVGKYISKSS